MTSTTSGPFEIDGSIWFKSGTVNWGSPRRMQLLAAIHEFGSISAAARHIDLSYKAAWDAVNSMNNLANEPLVLRVTTGRQGGGASLTPKALEMLALYQQMAEFHQLFIERITKLSPDSATNLDLLKTMIIQTSARNNFAGTISKINVGAVNAEVTLDIGNRHNIIATVTCESVENMELAEGKRVVAFLKASSVIVGLPSASQLSARNQLTGTITRIEPGAVNAEVDIEISPQHCVVATITSESLKNLNLEVGTAVIAIFKPSNVLLGTM